MPSSSLVEVEVEVWVEIEVGGEVEVGVEQKYVPQIRSNFTFSVGWGGWLEIWRVRLSQLPTWLKLKLNHELGNKVQILYDVREVVLIYSK